MVNYQKAGVTDLLLETLNFAVRYVHSFVLASLTKENDSSTLAHDTYTVFQQNFAVK